MCKDSDFILHCGAIRRVLQFLFSLHAVPHASRRGVRHACSGGLCQLFVTQRVTERIPKGGQSRCKRPSFTMQKAVFCKLKDGLL